MAREVGTEGKLGGQAEVRGVAGTWKDLTDNVNFMAAQPDRPGAQHRRRSPPRSPTATSPRRSPSTCSGEILELKNTINTMVDQLSSFASEVTRVAREVGTEGKLGGQAEVQGVAGTWKDLTDNVNFMAGNLTNQVRGIARVVTAVANGDLQAQAGASRPRARSPSWPTPSTTMIDTLATFADQVTTRGPRGRHRRQARRPGRACPAPPAPGAT